MQLGLPERLQERALELADGIGALAAAEDVAVAGGDVTRAPVLFLAVTVVGHAEAGDAPVRRAAPPTGTSSWSPASSAGPRPGCSCSSAPSLERSLDDAVADASDRPPARARPRGIAAGRLLAAQGASAMIDVSDGLAGDAGISRRRLGFGSSSSSSASRFSDGVAEVAEAAGVESRSSRSRAARTTSCSSRCRAERFRGEGGRRACRSRADRDRAGRGGRRGRAPAARWRGYEASGFDQLRWPEGDAAPA